MSIVDEPVLADADGNLGYRVEWYEDDPGGASLSFSVTRIMANTPEPRYERTLVADGDDDKTTSVPADACAFLAGSINLEGSGTVEMGYAYIWFPSLLELSALILYIHKRSRELILGAKPDTFMPEKS